MPRWRTATWAFLIFNVVMVGFVWLVLSSFLDPSSSCDHLPYGSDRTACAMGAGFGGAIDFIFGMAAIVIVWPIGVGVIGILWFMGRGGRTRSASRPDGVREHLREGSMEAEAPLGGTQDGAPDAEG